MTRQYRLDIKIISIENPENPHLIGLRDIYASATCYAFDLNRKLLATLGCCLSIFDCCGALGVDDVKDDLVPQRMQLSAYPNPFNSQTRITFEVPERGEISFKVFDQTGREVFSSPQSMREAGTHCFEWDAHGLPSGSYLFKLYYGDKVQSAKLVLVK